MKTKVSIICQNGHVFQQTPDNHLHGRGCNLCRNPIYDNVSFIDLAKLIHGDKYIYVGIYLNSKSKIGIVCKKHGTFQQTPNSHLSGSGCPKCHIESLSFNNEIFISRSISIHGNRYDYSLVKYINSKKTVIIICEYHGEFKQSPNSHLSGSGCKECMKVNLRNGFHDFKQRADSLWDGIWEYDEGTYFDSKSKLSVKCKNHGEFKVTPDNHISKKRGCPKCGNNVSKKEEKWLDSINIPKEWRQSIINIDGSIFKVDALDCENKIVYEFYGDYWHGNPKVYDPESYNQKNKKKFGELYEKTINRESKLIDFGYTLITKWETI